MSNLGHTYLEQLTDFGIKLGLDKIKFLLSKLGNPHRKYRSVLIAGTNGKGSVASFIAGCLKEAGYRVGFYTSPHLIRVEERIQINGKPIPSKVFDSLCLELKNLCMKLPIEMQPTYFEALTAVAFEYFRRENIDICVCEVGMGGRFDATNVLEPDIEVITPISYDHMEYLGNSIEEIAFEKAGIIKNHSLIVSGKQIPSAGNVLKRVSRQRNAKIFFYGKDFSARLIDSDFPRQQCFNFTGIKKLNNVSIRMFGSHQIHNAAVAIETLFLLNKIGVAISEDAILKGMKKTVWPARFQVLSEKPFVILDGAHNPAGIISLKRALKQYLPESKPIFLIAILKDKNWESMVKILSSTGKKFIFTQVNTPRSLLPSTLSSKMKELVPDADVETIENPSHAIEKLLSIRSDEPRVICGSLYLAGDVLKAFRKKLR
ncbi:MAG TPA: folylpolyglutamate synthase/dihydrofolate synthase family protein [bacterium]|nr:folylpolyglutamate synthase/dihydrofolate synthase family protein [bacterium]